MPLIRWFALCLLAFAPIVALSDDADPGYSAPVTEVNPNVTPTRQPQGSEIVVQGLSFLDIPYRYGGVSRKSGLDCSALVQKVFLEAIGLKLPRTTRAQSRTGEKIARKDLKPGDLVFFNTRRRAYSHVGIYVGDGHFLHAPSKGGKVRVERLNVRYWSKRFNGGRRVIIPPTQVANATAL